MGKVKVKNNLANNIRKLRREKKMSQTELADKVLITKSALGTYEQSVHEPSISTLVRLSEFFNVTIDELILNEDR